MLSQQSTATGLDIELEEITDLTAVQQHTNPHRQIQNMILKINDVKEITNYIQKADIKNRDKIKIWVLAYCCAHAKYSLAKTLIVNKILTLQDFLIADFTMDDVTPVLDILLAEKEMLPIYNFLSKEKLLHQLRTNHYPDASIKETKESVIARYSEHKEKHPADKLRICICETLATKDQFKENLYQYLNTTKEIEKKEIANTLRRALFDNPSPLNLLGNILFYPRDMSTTKKIAYCGAQTVATGFIAFGGIGVGLNYALHTRWQEAPDLTKGMLKEFLCLYGRITEPKNKFFQDHMYAKSMSALSSTEYEYAIGGLISNLRQNR